MDLAMRWVRVGVVAAGLVAGTSRTVWGQNVPAAGRVADLQLGATYSIAKSDYSSFYYPDTGKWHGYGFYGDFDVRRHFGLEFDFHELTSAYPVLYERTYEVGPRFLYPVKGRFVPYGKAMIGRGVFNFAGPDGSGNSVQIANLAYNIYTLGGGLDVKTLPGLNVRVFDYEYQTWLSFPALSLHPGVLSFGVAYHFHGDRGLLRR